MTTIEAQLELERTMRERGAENFELALKETEEAGRGAETAYARKLMKEFMLPLIDKLSEFLSAKTPGKGGKLRPLLRQCAPEKAMYIAMQSLFNHFTMDASLTHLAAKIGTVIEDEVRFSKFQENYADYYKKIKEDFARKGTKDYRYMHRVLTHKANEHQDGWADWSQDERVQIGVKLLDIILEHTDLIEKVQYFERGKTRTRIVPTQSAKDWIDKHNDITKFMFPDRMPCIIQPDDWTTIWQGGYYSPEMRNVQRFIKTQNKVHKKYIQDADLSQVFSAANHLQQTPWQVNMEILEIVRAAWAKNLAISMPQSEPYQIPPSPIPEGIDKSTLTVEQQERFTDWKHEAAEIHTKEAERVAKSYQVSRIIRMANEYSKYNRFFYVWYADFRGRLYSATTGFSTQGPDLAKGLVKFANGKPVGERGWYWLRVHGANRYGYDKVSYDKRVLWVDERREQFIAAANDPLSYTELWANADKPWQFLSFLFEYRDAIALESLGRSVTEHVSYLPIGLDGSCNGLQNFSAMLRDAVGGAATNLIPTEVPADIYAAVARVCTGKIIAAADADPDDTFAQRWKEFCTKYGSGSIPRSMAKRPVMTLPYGATRQSCTAYIFESILDIDREFFEGNFKAACWLTPFLWESIGEVVIAAREAMGWLQQCAGVLSKENLPIYWTAPDGFPAYQGVPKIETFKIETQLAGRFQIKIGRFTDQLDRNAQRTGVSPNFVHSCDSAHMREVIRRCMRAGIQDLAMIHDDYGTHACHIDTLHKIIREAFVDMYTEHDPLKQFREQNSQLVELPELPPQGTLEIKDVLKSEFFFG